MDGKRIFQNLLFPEGIIYNRESDSYRTTRINAFFSPIPELARALKGQKKRDSIKNDKIPHLVNPSGKMSNFLADDFDAVLKFVRLEKQKRSLAMPENNVLLIKNLMNKF